MKKLHFVSAMVLTGVVIAAAFTGTAAAWHPKGVIKKLVQNQTTNSAVTDANTASVAVAAKPGDVLKYVIQVSNNGNPDSRGWNDMTKTVMTDTLPAGVELVSDPAQRTIQVSLGTLKPGQTVTKEYLVKVTATKKGVIENKACFTGDSAVNDSPQEGCDVANVKVDVPVVPEPPKTPEPPVQPPVSTPPAVLPAELPKTGPANVVGIFAGVSGLGYALHRIVSRKQR